ncbi:hypothetical protein FOCC_FOCC015496 [Frankliniella occidentalis]|nr:hypothetical protein FOCC_FOCC015496 [Frankliniella occidentalis]
MPDDPQKPEHGMHGLTGAYGAARAGSQAGGGVAFVVTLQCLMERPDPISVFSADHPYALRLVALVGGVRASMTMVLYSALVIPEPIMVLQADHPYVVRLVAYKPLSKATCLLFVGSVYEP